MAGRKLFLSSWNRKLSLAPHCLPSASRESEVDPYIWCRCEDIMNTQALQESSGESHYFAVGMCVLGTCCSQMLRCPALLCTSWCVPSVIGLPLTLHQCSSVWPREPSGSDSVSQRRAGNEGIKMWTQANSHLSPPTCSHHCNQVSQDLKSKHPSLMCWQGSPDCKVLLPPGLCEMFPA